MKPSKEDLIQAASAKMHLKAALRHLQASTDHLEYLRQGSVTQINRVSDLCDNVKAEIAVLEEKIAEAT